MPKKKPTKTKQDLVHRILKHQVLLFFIGIALSWFLVHSFQIASEHRKFNEAEKKLDAFMGSSTLPSDIKNKFEKDNSCIYSSRKFSRGDRSCSSGYSVPEIKNMSYEEAARISNIIKGSLEKSSLFSAHNVRGSIGKPNTTDGSETQSMIVDLDDGSKEPSCHASATYTFVPKYKGSSGYVENEKSFYKASIYCSGTAKSEYYPVQN